MSESLGAILVVDDEPDLREVLAYELEPLGRPILEACDGSEAYELVARESVDLVITDIRMPGGGGVELLERLKACDAFRPKVFLVTGYTDVTEPEALDRGAEGIFLKPFDRRMIREHIELALMGRRRENVPVTESLEATEAAEIGRGGMFVAMSRAFPAKGTHLTFCLGASSSGLARLEGTGLVRWCRKEESPEGPTGCGIEFTGLTSESETSLSTFLARSRPRAYIPLKQTVRRESTG